MEKLSGTFVEEKETSRRRQLSRASVSKSPRRVRKGQHRDIKADRRKRTEDVKFKGINKEIKGTTAAKIFWIDEMIKWRSFSKQDN